MAAKWLFRRSCQLFINEALGRQRLFNSQVRDLTAQLAAEVIRLRARVEALEAEKAKAGQKAPPPAEEEEDPGMIKSLQELWQYRALLWNLTQRELKARYRGSALGFLWTFVNPLLLMAVYALALCVQLSVAVISFYQLVATASG